MNRLRVGFGLFFAATIFVYWPTLRGPFLVWDDTQHFLLNSALLKGEWWAFWQRSYYGLYIPATYTIWTWLYAVWADPLAFHLLNLLLHLLNGVLVFRLARPHLSENNALFVTAIFYLHPLQVESVAWISGGRDLLAAFFALLALTTLQSRRLGAAWAVGTPLFVFALFCKPHLVLLPVVVWMMQPHRWRLALFWAAASAAVAIGTTQIQNDFILTHVAPTLWWERGLIALDSLGFYVSKWFVPWPLASNYTRTPELVLNNRFYIQSGALILGIAVLALYPKFRRHKSTHALVISLLLLLPVSGLIPFSAQALSTVADRYMYLPMIGLAAAVSPLALRLRWVAPAILLGCAALSWARVPVWTSNRELAHDMLQYNPKNYEALNNLATEELAAGNVATSISLLNEARALKPNRALALSNLAHAHWIQGNLQFILKEIYPYLSQTDFIRFNRLEGDALALMYRMSARAHLSVGESNRAQDLYCHAIWYGRHDPWLQKEVHTVFDMAKCASIHTQLNFSLKK